MLFFLVLVLAGVFFFLGLDQGEAVGQRDLVVIRVDFRECEEAMAVAAILHEGGLERGLHARHLGEVDIALQLAARGAFEVEFLDAVPLDDDHAGLFGVGGIDEHLAAHVSIPLRRHGKPPRFSAPVRRRPWDIEMLLRDRGIERPPADGYEDATGARLDRSSCSALVVAWVMPKIVLVFR